MACYPIVLFMRLVRRLEGIFNTDMRTYRLVPGSIMDYQSTRHLAHSSCWR